MSIPPSESGPSGEDALQALREALRLSPNNTPLRQHLADLLLASGRAAEAETEQAVMQYRRALEKDPATADSALAATLGIDADEQKSEVVEGRVRNSWDQADAPLAAEVERPQITFKDVGGMEVLKEEIRLKIIHPLAHPELYRAYGK